MSAPDAEPDPDFDDGQNLDCTHCGGDGYQDEPDDPINDGPGPYPCTACRGTGERKHQWLF